MAVSRGARLLAKWRSDNGYSQFDAGKLLDLSANKISGYENGATPGLRTAKRFEERTQGFVEMGAWLDLEDDAVDLEPVAAHG